MKCRKSLSICWISWLQKFCQTDDWFKAKKLNIKSTPCFLSKNKQNESVTLPTAILLFMTMQICSRNLVRLQKVIGFLFWFLYCWWGLGKKEKNERKTGYWEASENKSEHIAGDTGGFHCRQNALMQLTSHCLKHSMQSLDN